MLRLARFDGSQALTTEPTYDGPASKSLLAAALRAGGNKVDRELATIALPGYKPKTNPDTWDAPSGESEWSEVATLRGSWSRKAAQLHLAYDGGNTSIEVGVGKHTLFAGRHDFAISRDGRAVKRRADSEWEQVCWESDDDITYVELEMPLAGDLHLQRSYLLAHEDEFLVIADAIISTSAAKLQHRAELPLIDEVFFEPESETREGTFAEKKPFARAIPLALPEWRDDPRGGQLFVEDGSLVLEQETAGSSMFVPLFIDLSAKRRRKQLTWRQLTVAEELKIQTSDVAVGYRMQVGREQWLLYRSLAPTGPRTVLGQHLISEFFCARFTETGEAESLIEVE